jgi:plastocyanin
MKPILALALVAALFAGCSGSTTSGPITPQKDAQGNYVIHMMASNLFSPADAKVPVGANVTWVHDGGAAHNVVDLGGSFRSQAVSSGSYAHTFATAGTFHYHCEFHNGMDGTLTVG